MRAALQIQSSLHMQVNNRVETVQMNISFYSNTGKGVINSNMRTVCALRSSTQILTLWCFTVGLARTLAVPDSGIADDSSTSSTFSEEIKRKRFLSAGTRTVNSHYCRLCRLQLYVVFMITLPEIHYFLKCIKGSFLPLKLHCAHLSIVLLSGEISTF